MISSLKYLDFIREKDCSVCGQDASPHHMNAVGMGRNRKKELAEHYSTVPLCHLHHTDYHKFGHIVFKGKYGVDLWRVATSLLIEYCWSKQIVV